VSKPCLVEALKQACLHVEVAHIEGRPELLQLEEDKDACIAAAHAWGPSGDGSTAAQTATQPACFRHDVMMLATACWTRPILWVRETWIERIPAQKDIHGAGAQASLRQQTQVP
jgi:hypothetical protein